MKPWRFGDSNTCGSGPPDEILKDADALHHSLSDPAKAVRPRGLARYAKLCVELGSAD